jgi:hypothetical protein
MCDACIRTWKLVSLLCTPSTESVISRYCSVVSDGEGILPPPPGVFARTLKIKVKFSRYRPEQALGDPEG